MAGPSSSPSRATSNRTDPALVDDANSSYVLQQIFEGLVTLKPGTGSEIVGQLADSWTISDDGLTYTFKLRSGIKFQDGTDFNAAAAKVNFDRWMSIPKSYTDLGYNYYFGTVFGRQIARDDGAVIRRPS